MTLTTAQRTDATRRLIRVATGDDGPYYSTVYNYGIGYAEPGYHDADTVWVFGNWNDKDTYDRATGTWTTTSTMPSRLARALERIGVEVEWSDEWTECVECHQAIRTQPDSYGWSRSYIETDDGNTCHVCLTRTAAEYATDRAHHRQTCYFTVDEILDQPQPQPQPRYRPEWAPRHV